MREREQEIFEEMLDDIKTIENLLKKWGLFDMALSMARLLREAESEYQAKIDGELMEKIK